MYYLYFKSKFHLKKAQNNTLDHLYKLHDQYKLTLTAASKIRYLENYIKMLESEIIHLENRAAEALKLIKKQERLGSVKRFFKGSFDMDAKLEHLSSEVTESARLIKSKYKEIELSKYELSVLQDLYIHKDQVRQDYISHFDLVLSHFIPENLSDQGVIIQFRNQKEILESKRHEIHLHVQKLDSVKKILDELHSVFMRIVYGYQDENTPNFNIFTDGDVKKIRRLSQEFLELLPDLKGIHTSRNLKLITTGEQKLTITFTALSTFNRMFFNLNLQYGQYANVVTTSKIRINEDFKSLNSDLELIDLKITQVVEDSRKWFRKMLKLDY